MCSTEVRSCGYDAAVPSTPTAPAETTAARASRLDRAAAGVACLLVTVALGIIWIARVSIGRDVYVSVMGATGMPTADWFRSALMLVAAGGGLAAFVTRAIRVSPPIVRLWPPAVSLACASGLFLLASQVTCTPGCPIPYGPSFTWPDFTHTTSAVLAFAFACWAMLQLTFAADHRLMSRLSLCCGVAVAVIAATGGIMSLAGWDHEVGSRFEFIATTIAIGWLISLALVSAVPPPPPPAWRRGTRPSRRLAPALRSVSRRAAFDARARRSAPDEGGLSVPQ